MTDVAERYRRLSGDVARRIESVPPDRWDSPSPCVGWTARDVLVHLIEVHGTLTSFAGVTLSTGPSVDDGPAAAWTHVSREMQELLEDPDRAGSEFEGYAGRTTLATTIDKFLCFDLIVHGWDIARATGTDETIPAQDLADLEAFVNEMGEGIRQPGVCGPAIEVAGDADYQTQVLGLLGRKA